MSDFKNKVGSAFQPLIGSRAQTFIGSESQVFQAHSKLVEFSDRAPDGKMPEGSENYNELCMSAEKAALAVLLDCANSVAEPKCREKFSENKQDVERSVIRLAGISMMQCDIAKNEPAPNAALPLHMSKPTENHNIVAVTPDANSDALYDYKKWRDDRLERIEASLKAKANIIVIGEFDYPPFFKTQDDNDFNTRVRALINRFDHEIFLIAGTRHERLGKGKAQKWFNHAKIFVNKNLDTVERSDDDNLPSPMNHAKLVPAESMGEQIDTPFPTAISYYETAFGQIAVLVCKDVYSPNVVLSLVNRKDADAKDRLDYILIPSYNTSRKFYYACQVLSLISNTTVMLVDTCDNYPGKPAHVVLFVCGRVFTDAMENPPECQDNDIGDIEIPDEHPNTRIWTLNRDYVVQQRALYKKRTPYFNEVDLFKDSLAREVDG